MNNIEEQKNNEFNETTNNEINNTKKKEGQLQYEHLKRLNKKLTLFKKQSNQSGKKDEETEQTMRR